MKLDIVLAYSTMVNLLLPCKSRDLKKLKHSSFRSSEAEKNFIDFGIKPSSSFMLNYIIFCPLFSQSSKNAFSPLSVRGCKASSSKTEGGNVEISAPIIAALLT